MSCHLEVLAWKFVVRQRRSMTVIGGPDSTLHYLQSPGRTASPGIGKTFRGLSVSVCVCLCVSFTPSRLCRRICKAPRQA